MKMANHRPESGAPRATYRLQLTAEHGLDHAASIVDYLAALGVSHLYTSPFFRAAPGSMHGYDGVDPEHISKDLGDEKSFHQLAAALKRHGLGLVVDLVPNHLSLACRENWRWWDVLRFGRQSRYADWFDVDWDSPEARPAETVLLPILGDHVGICIEKAEIRLTLALHDEAHDSPAAPEERVELAYYEQQFPVAPGSVPGLAAGMGNQELQATLERINNDPEALEAVVAAQHYRLAYWKTGPDELNYRRFFAVNELVGVRVELPHVFQETHRRVLELVQQGIVNGLRIDHPDGLRDPAGYLRRLRAETPDIWTVVEKILEPDEQLPDDWPVQGTTGYDFLNQLGTLWIDPRGETELSLLYARLTGFARTGMSDDGQSYATVLRESKAHVGRVLFGTETTRLVELLSQVCQANSRHRDYTRPQLRAALERLLVAFPVYRSYIVPDEPDEPRETGDPQVSEQDARNIRLAAAEALKGTIGLKSTSMFRNTIPSTDDKLIEFIRDVLLMRIGGPSAGEFICRFQQLTGPLMAKGAEDTAFYRYNRLVALNEVGGDPATMSLPLADFHTLMIQSAARSPTTMRTTSTHDTKRSEDVRLRIALLSEIAGQWAEAVSRWERLASPMCPHQRPDANDRYFIYQTLVGTWPITLQRLQDYMLKADREAKRHTSWKDPAPQYEDDLRAFLERLLADETFVGELQHFVAPLINPARRISLAQTLVKLTVPGVPDIYQGCELEDLSLVDPDNRHPVDFDRRRALLSELVQAERRGQVNVDQILARMDESLPKLFVTRRSLALRQSLPQAFAAGAGYQPLWAAGPLAEHVVAFARTPNAADAAVVTTVPRWLLRMGDLGWSGTSITLPPGSWRNVFTDATHDGNSAVEIARLLADFPVALLARADLLDASPIKQILAGGFDHG